MRRFMLLIIFIGVVSGCSSQEATYELCGTGPTVVINNTEYIQSPTEQKTYKLDQQLGEIEEQIDEQFHPEENFTSNFLEVGALVYSVKDHPDYIIAKTTENKYLLFQKY
ncbi:hypothetical protein [Bacillus sp. AK128]